MNPDQYIGQRRRWLKQTSAAAYFTIVDVPGNDTVTLRNDVFGDDLTYDSLFAVLEASEHVLPLKCRTVVDLGGVAYEIRHVAQNGDVTLDRCAYADPPATWGDRPWRVVRKEHKVRRYKQVDRPLPNLEPINEVTLPDGTKLKIRDWIETATYSTTKGG